MLLRSTVNGGHEPSFKPRQMYLIDRNHPGMATEDANHTQFTRSAEED